MNPNERNPRRVVRLSFIGVLMLAVGLLVAIYNREIREHLSLRPDSVPSSRASIDEPSNPLVSDSIAIPTGTETEAIERPDFYEPGEPRFDLTQHKSDVCPVHKIKMEAKLVEIRFQFEGRWFSEFEKSKNDEFPFAYALVGGCYVSPIAPPNSGLWFFCGTGLPPPTFAKMFVCTRCLAAYETAVRAFNPKAVAVRRAEEAEAVRRAQRAR